MEEFYIYAKPHISDVMPYTIIVQPSSSLVETDSKIHLIGNFLNVRNIYLSSVDNNIFNQNTTYFNPFSSIKNLSADNVGFNGIEISNYIIQNEKYITINQSLSFLNSGYIDVIVENEAGFGILSKDSRVPFLSAWAGLLDIQKPSISGIQIKLI